MLPSPLLETRQLSKSFGVVQALRNVDLHIYPGDVYVLLGPNGAGKTTALGLLTRLLTPTSGTILFSGQIGELAGFIGLPPLYPHLSASDNLGISYMVRGQKINQKRIQAVLEQVGLNSAIHRQAGEFSTGMRQRLGIARALLFQPRLIILDEPTSGLDPEGIVEIRQMILSLNRELGLTWLISSHMLGEVEQIATRVSILMGGVQRIEATMDSLRDNDAVYVIETDDLSLAKATLPSSVVVVSETEQSISVRLENTMKPAELNQRLVQNRVAVSAFRRAENKLETAYFQICYGNEREKL